MASMLSSSHGNCRVTSSRSAVGGQSLPVWLTVNMPDATSAFLSSGRRIRTGVDDLSTLIQLAGAIGPEPRWSRG